MSSVPSAPSVRSGSFVAVVLALVALVLAIAALVWVATADDRGSGPASAVEGSGVAASQTRELAPFTGVELAGVNDVTVTVGDEQRVIVHADDNLVGLVTTEVTGDVLVIDDDDDVTLDAVTPMRVEITVPSLDSVSLSGTGTVTLDGADLGTLSVAIPGAGTVGATGSVTTLDVDLAGAGNAELGELVARDATVVLSGVGNVVVHVTGSLDADVSGAGSVTYRGDPERIEQTITGVGSVTRE